MFLSLPRSSVPIPLQIGLTPIPSSVSRDPCLLSLNFPLQVRLVGRELNRSYPKVPYPPQLKQVGELSHLTHPQSPEGPGRMYQR